MTSAANLRELRVGLTYKVACSASGLPVQLLESGYGPNGAH